MRPGPELRTVVVRCLAVLCFCQLSFSHETVSKLLREGLTDKEIEISVVHRIEHTDGAYLNEAYENDADDL